MFLVSVDPGYKYLGLALWSSEGELHSSFRIQGMSRQDDETFDSYRSRNLWFWVGFWDDLTKVLKEGHAGFVLERVPMVGASTQMVLAITNVSIIETICTLQNIPLYYMSATHIKKFVTGNAKATKSQMRRAIVEIYPEVARGRKVTEIPFDEIDAIAVGYTYTKEKNGKEGSSTPQNTTRSI